MRLAYLFVIVGLLAACGGQATRQANVARFDFGPPVMTPATVAGVVAVEVVAPSWLADGAMQYRLLYAEPARRREYAESRWVAPPAELLRQAMERRLVGASRCRLRLELDEFVQAFDSAAASRLLLSGRARLHAGGELVAGWNFAIERPATSPDAKGGAAAAAAVVAALGDELAAWLAQSPKCRPE